MRYKVLKQLNGKFRILINLGIIPINIWDWVVMYEYYLEERKSNAPSLLLLPDRKSNRVSETTIRNLVKWMES
jgi:hypothetical protein